MKTLVISFVCSVAADLVAFRTGAGTLTIERDDPRPFRIHGSSVQAIEY